MAKQQILLGALLLQPTPLGRTTSPLTEETLGLRFQQLEFYHFFWALEQQTSLDQFLCKKPYCKANKHWAFEAV